LNDSCTSSGGINVLQLYLVDTDPHGVLCGKRLRLGESLGLNLLPADRYDLVNSTIADDLAHDMAADADVSLGVVVCNPSYVAVIMPGGSGAEWYYTKSNHKNERPQVPVPKPGVNLTRP